METAELDGIYVVLNDFYPYKPLFACPDKDTAERLKDALESRMPVAVVSIPLITAVGRLELPANYVIKTVSHE